MSNSTFISKTSLEASGRTLHEASEFISRDAPDEAWEINVEFDEVEPSIELLEIS